MTTKLIGVSQESVRSEPQQFPLIQFSGTISYREGVAMTQYKKELSIDFSKLPWWREDYAFRIRLDTTPLSALIEVAHAAHRVYELFQIDRPGDIWDYVWVILEEVPEGISSRFRRIRPVASCPGNFPLPWPEGHIPFNVFDKVLSVDSEEPDPEETGWLLHRESPAMRSFADDALHVVRIARLSLKSSDPLRAHIAATVSSGTHPYCYLDRQVALDRARQFGPNTPVHSAAFYEKLSALLNNPQVGSVAYRADGDYRVLRMMAMEQRRRANLSQQMPGVAYPLSALVNQQIDNDAWDSKIDFYEEGIGNGDLFVDGGGLGDGRLMTMMCIPRYVPRLFLLTSRDEGQMAGFDQVSGEGWVLYQKHNPGHAPEGNWL